MPARMLLCPICRKKVAFNDPNMPFCSDRCRVQDLANWASEKYVISTPRTSDESDDSERLEEPESPNL